MKKLIFLMLTLFITVSCKPGSDKNPLRFKGCVVVEKMQFLDGWGIRLKLTRSLRDSLDCDYKWIAIPKWEWNKFNVGDTIK